MKKYIYFLILTILSFIPILKVNALINVTSNINNLYGQFTADANIHMEWLYNTSDDYLFSYIEDYDYKNISVYIGDFTYNGYSSTIIGINIFGNTNNVGIASYVSDNNQYGYFNINGSTDRFLQYYIYYNPNDNKYYHEYNFQNEITELTDNERTRNLGVSANKYLWELSGNLVPYNQNFTPYQIYYSNMSFANVSKFRPLNLYNENDELIGTYGKGDEVPSWRNYYKGLPSYLTGYEKVGLTPSDSTIIISNISKGSIYISVEDFNKCSGLFGYFDKELTSQPYSSVITEYIKTFDGLYIRQDFDLSSYPGADYVYYQKCQYIEGNDDIYKYLWLPDENYTSPITSTENNTGGLDYSYRVEENGEIVENTFSSLDNILNNNNPLLNTFFNDFSTNYFGISSIITAPLSLINQLSSATCLPLNLPFPYTNDKYLQLPCMSEIYEESFGELFNLYQFLLLGFISYRLGISIFYDIKKLKDPNNDEVEVINL